MSFFSKIFSSKPSSKQEPNIPFGRYSDAYKSEQKYDAWDRAIAKFKSEDFLGMYREFFYYLSDEDEANVVIQEKEDEIEFIIYQGSKKIEGKAGKGKFRAEAKIAKTDGMHLGFLRRLIEDNFNLKFGRYCLDQQNDIAIVFDSFVVDGSPYKLYYGLKEIALAADKRDDLFLEEFNMLAPVNMGHVLTIPDQQKAIKIAYLKAAMNDTLDEVRGGQLDAHQYAGGITYLLLDTVYRLDFLIRPEGHMMEAFERMHRSYFAADGLSSVRKNQILVQEIQALLERPTAKLQAELYHTKSTFGIINSSSHQKLRQIIEGELDNMDWYLENRYERVALAVPGYIVGHALFYYSLPEPDKDLLLLYYQIMEHKYFSSLGFALDLRTSDEGFNEMAIRNAIEQIVELHRGVYPDINPQTRNLRFDSAPAFAKSYLRMMSQLELNRAR